MQTIKGYVTHAGNILIYDNYMTGIFIECDMEDLKVMRQNIIFSDVEVRVIEAEK
jgi:hypothetical protein